MYNITIPVFIKSLANLGTFLEKAAKEAEEKKFDLDHLLSDRLYPDMFNFTRQVQIACDAAKGTAARLAGIEPPKHEDVEKTVPELKEHIDKVVAFLKTIKPEQIEGSEDRPVKVPTVEGKYLTGFEYISEMYLPNFFFHITTAYLILRHNGISVGKADYIGSLSLKDIEETN